MIRAYHQYDNILTENRELFCTSRGQLKITHIEPKYFCVKDLNDKEYSQKYFDIGHNLFFNKEDYLLRDSCNFPTEKYQPYNKSESLDEVMRKIDDMDFNFFRGKDYHDKELHIENQYCIDTQKIIKEKLRIARGDQDSKKYMSNGNSKDYDPSESSFIDDSQDQVRIYEKLKREPYFGEIIKVNGEPIYIGEKAIEGRVFDSRDEKIADLWYLKDVHKKRNKLELIRTFDFFDCELFDFQDEYNAYIESEEINGDEFLQRIIEANRKNQEMVSIAKSIAENQYRIIRKEFDENFLIEGCAGSGKTMILLHRLSFLLFNNKHYNPNQYYIISPNEILNSVSDSIVKDLELDRVNKNSLNNFYDIWIQRYIDKNSLFCQKDFSKEYILNDMLNQEIVDQIYDTDVLDEFSIRLHNILQNHYDDYHECDYVDTVNKNIRAAYYEILGNQDDVILQIYEQVADEYISICDHLSVENVRARLKILESKYRELSNMFSTEEKNAITSKGKKFKNELVQLNKDLFQKECSLAKLLSLLQIEDAEDEMELSIIEKQRIMSRKSEELENEIIRIRQEIKRHTTLVLENQDLQKKYAQLRNTKKEYDTLKFFAQTENLRGKAVYTNSGELSQASALFNEALQFAEKYSQLFAKSLVKRNGSLKALLEGLSNTMRWKRRFQHFIEIGMVNEYLCDIIHFSIQTIKESLELDLNSEYEFERFYFLYGLYSVLGPIRQESVLFSIDEYQDCSICDLNLISKLFPAAVFNLYGETMQSISKKGIKSQDIVLENRKITKYPLNINYRNGKEITDYINDYLGTKMIAIGIPSIVKTYSDQDFLDIVPSGTQRIALIVKSRKEYRILKRNTKNDIFFTNDKMRIDKNKINVFPIQLVKGLEFEEVYVYTLNMKHNEKYVAFTRALEKLNIIQFG